MLPQAATHPCHTPAASVPLLLPPIQVALHNQLWRHYSWTALAEARRMLGGAGPAIAAIPATVLWAGISLVDMAADVAAHRLSLSAVPPRIGYILTTSAGQVR